MTENSPLKVKLSFTNCYFIPCNDGYMQIDTSYPGDYKKYLNKIQNLNISLSEIKYLFLTHHHDDHAGFLSQLKENSDIKIIAQEKALSPLKSGESLRDSSPLNKRILIIMGLMSLFHRFTFPPIELSEEDVIIRGDDKSFLKTIGINGTILSTPGHTDDHQAIILPDGSTFAGDITMNFLKFAGLKRRPIFVKDINQVFQSWEKLLKNGAKKIYPAHGGPFDAEDLRKYLKVLNNREFKKSEN